MTIRNIIKCYLSVLVKSSPKGYHVKLRKMLFIIDYLNRLFPLLNDKMYNIGTKTYWILHDINDFPKCKRKECLHILNHKNAIVTTGYGAGYCSVSCEMNDIEHLNKLIEIFQKLYGANSFPESECFKQCMYNFYEQLSQDDLANINKKRENTCLELFGVKNVLCKESKIRQLFEDENIQKFGKRTINNSEKACLTRKKHNEEDENYQKKINEKTKIHEN